MKSILLSLALLAVAIAGQAQSWTNYYGGPAELDDEVRAIVLDSNGNVFVAGTSAGSAGDAIVKYSNAGQALWTNFTESAHALATDNSGNLIVTGISSDWDYVTMKYSSSGLPLWTNRYGGVPLGLDGSRGIVVDAEGNVVVSGDSQNVAGDFSSLELATIKYSSGGVPLWTNRYRGMWVEQFRDMTMDPNGNVILAGAGDTIKYSSTGQPLWTNAFNGSPGSTGGYPLAARVDTNGNVMVTGGSRREVIIDGNLELIDDVQTIKYSAAGATLWTNVTQESWGNGQEMALVVDITGNTLAMGPFSLTKLSPAGSPIWSRSYLGWLHLNSVAVDNAGDVFVTGYTTSVFGDRATIKYSSAGVPAWTNMTTTFISAEMAAEANGNLFVSCSAPHGANRDWATLKYAAELVRPPLNIHRLANSVVVSWTNAAFELQSAPAITGTFTNIPGATSPHTNPISGGQQFFRLVQ